jgi:hypothetical protein
MKFTYHAEKMVSIPWLDLHSRWSNHVEAHVSTGWWMIYPSEKNISQLGLFFPRYRKIQTTNQSMIKCLCLIIQ